MASKISLGKLTFERFISAEEIQSIVETMAKTIDDFYRGKSVIAIVVLKGAYLFASDLLRACESDVATYFVQLSSYDGLASSGSVKVNLGHLPDVSGKHILLIEDIVDSGLSMTKLLEHQAFEDVASVEIATLLHKPDSDHSGIALQFIGKAIPSAFVLGYGLDYNELGRNLPDIYQLVE